jgi:hypothetical protein
MTLQGGSDCRDGFPTEPAVARHDYDVQARTPGMFGHLEVAARRVVEDTHKGAAPELREFGRQLREHHLGAVKTFAADEVENGHLA